jgi:hypothetical protein
MQYFEQISMIANRDSTRSKRFAKSKEFPESTCPMIASSKFVVTKPPSRQKHRDAMPVS